MPTNQIKRTHYFAGEALLTDDFSCEQRYHMEMLRYNNLGLHTSGIANGLEVSWDPSNESNQVSVSAGMALDSEGREIILLQPQVLKLTDIQQNASYFLTIHYHEVYSDYTDSSGGGSAGYKRIVQQPQILYQRNLPDPGLYILLAVIDFTSTGSINQLSYNAGKYQRRYVGSIVGSVQFVSEGAGISQSRSTAPLGEFMGKSLPSTSSISARKENSGNGASDSNYLLIDAPRAQFSGATTVRGNLGVGVDQPYASFQVDAPVFNGNAILLSSDGQLVTLTDTFSPFLEVGDILISDPSIAQGASQKRSIIKVDQANQQVTVDRAFSPQLASIGFTYIRSTLARLSASNGMIGNGSLMQIDVDGNVGLGLQASVNNGAPANGLNALVITTDRKVGIGMNDGAPQAALDVKGEIRADSLTCDGDITATGRIIANSFEGNGEKLKNLPILSYWTKEVVGSDVSNLYYNTGNVGIRTTDIPASLSVGGGRAFVGTGLISIDATKTSDCIVPGTVTIIGYQTLFTAQINQGDTIATGKVIDQRHVVLQVVSDTELQLEQQFPIPITNSAFSVQAQDSSGSDSGAITPGAGSINSNGTQILGTGTQFISAIKPGDAVIVQGFQLDSTPPAFNWYVYNVVSDTELTLIQRKGVGAVADPLGEDPVFSAVVSAFVVTPALLAHFKAEQSSLSPGSMPMPPAMLITTNGGDKKERANTVAININLDEIDSQYALQVCGDVNFSAGGHFNDITAVTLEVTQQATIAAAAIETATIETATIGNASIATGSLDNATIKTGSITTATMTTANMTNATVSGNLNARQSTIAMVGNGQGIAIGSWTNPATYQVSTDGFVVGLIGWPSNHTDGCMAWMTAYSGSVRMLVTGGNVGYFGPGWSDCMGSNGNTLLLPVSAGNIFSIGADQGTAGQQSDAPLSAWWIPMGAGAANQLQSAERIEDVQNDMPAPSSVIQTPNTQAADDKLVTALEKILGKTINSDQRTELLTALRQF